VIGVTDSVLRLRLGALSTAIVCVSISALIVVPTAAAEKTHLFDSATTANFGSIEHPLGLSIDQSNGDVYAASLDRGSIYKYTASGEPVTTFGGGSGHATVPFGPWQLAVDQASHDLYVTSGEYGNTVEKLDSEGHVVTSFGTNGNLTVAEPIGVAVDPSNGNLYVASYAESKIEVFSSAGVQITEFSTLPATPTSLAVNASGQVFVGGGYGGYGGLERFSPSGSFEGLVQGGAYQGVAIDPATGDVYASQPEELFQYSPSGETLISKFGSGVVSDAWGIGVNESTEEVYAASFAGSSIDAFGPMVVLADVSTDPPSPENVEHTTAMLTGHIDIAGGPPVTKCVIEYGPTTEYASGKVPCENTTPITASTDVSATITSLSPPTNYHYRFAATNEGGTSFGQDQTVEPPAIFGLQTNQATEMSTTTATLNGTFQVDSEGGPTHYYFEWGLGKAYGKKTPTSSESTSGVRDVSVVIDNLTFYTLYHYRIVATNSFGTAFGADQSFYTESPNPPSIDSSSSSNVTPEEAVLHADVNPGFGPTIVRFEYGPDLSYGSKTPPSNSIGEDGVDHPVSSAITGLQPGTTYHYRALAVNFTGLVVGPDRTFDTPSLPVVSGGAASNVTQTTATISASIQPSFSPTTYHFEYGLTSLYGSSTPQSASIGSDMSVHAATATVAALTPATTYHYRVLATNTIGTASGSDRTFTTAAPPPPPAACRHGFVSKQGKCVRKPAACRHGFVRRQGKCVRKRRGHHHKSRRHNRGGKE
jgi:hypothetical protein